jgi:hypothetical protein
LLATLACSDPAFPAAATDLNPGGSMAASAITSDDSADADGTAGYFVAGSSNDGSTILTKVIMGTAGITSDSTDLTLDDKEIVTGGVVAVTAWTINMPES